MIQLMNIFVLLLLQGMVSLVALGQEGSLVNNTTNPRVVFQPPFQKGISAFEISPNKAHFMTAEGDITTLGGMQVKLWDFKSRIMIASQFFGSENGRGSGKITLMDDGVFYLSLNHSIIKMNIVESTIDTVFTVPYPQFIHAYIVQNDQLIVSTKLLPEDEGKVTDITNQTILYSYDCKKKQVVSSKKFDYEIPYLKSDKAYILYSTNKGDCHFIDLNLEEKRAPIQLYSKQTPRFLHVLNENILLSNAAIGKEAYEMEVGEGKIDFFDLKTGAFIRNSVLTPNMPPVNESVIELSPSDRVSSILVKPNSLLVKYGYNGIAEIPLDGSTISYHDIGLKEDGIAFLSPIDASFKEFFMVHGPVNVFGSYDEYSIVNLDKGLIYKTSKPVKVPLESVLNLVEIEGDMYVAERSSNTNYGSNDELFVRNHTLTGGTLVICENCNLIIKGENPNWIIQNSSAALVINLPRSILNKDTLVLSIKKDYQTGYSIPNEPDIQILHAINFYDFKDPKKVVSHLYGYFPKQDQYLVRLEWGTYENQKRALALLSGKAELVKLLIESDMLSNVSFDTENGIIAFSVENKKSLSELHLEKWKESNWVGQTKLLSNLWEYALQIDMNAQCVYYMRGLDNTHENFGLFSSPFDQFEQETMLHSTDFYANFYLDSKSKQLLFSSGDYLKKIDLNSNKLVWEKYAENVNDVYFASKSNKVLVQFDDHSMLFDQNLEDYHTFYFFENHSMICYRSDGYYMSPGYSADNFGFVIKNKGYRFSQFDIKYNRPDLIMSSLNICPEVLKESFAKAQRKRLKRYNFVENSNLHFPELELTSEFESFTTTSEKVTLQFQCSDTVSNLKSWNIWINNIPLFGKSGYQFSKNTKSITLSQEVLLSEGNNLIQIACLNEEGNESLKESIQLTYVGTLPAAKTHFIGIGIDQFKEEGHDLSYSVKDVRDLAQAMKAKLGDQLTIDTLFNQNVSISNVKALKKRLLETNINDKVIISYSGHGLLSKEYDYYLSSYTVNFQQPEIGGIPYEVLEELLDSIPARQKLLLIDACHSGEVDKDDFREIATVAGAKGILKSRGADAENTSTTNTVGLQNSFQLMQELFVNVQKGSGATIISAAAGDQFALEGGKLKNGFFTYAILQYIAKNQSVGINELKKYVYAEVERLSGGLQKPTSRIENLELDWRMW